MAVQMQGGPTVVYESAMTSVFYVFKHGGSYSSLGSANVISCPELASSSTLHFFDCKAGHTAIEPTITRAKLVVISSTNQMAYKQTARRDLLEPLLFPATTAMEYDAYARLFGIDEALANDIAAIAGKGKLRSLSKSVHAVRKEIEVAAEKFKPDMMSSYCTEGPEFSSESPALLLTTTDLKENGTLLERYTFSNNDWDFASGHILTEVMKRHLTACEVFISQFFLVMTDENIHLTFGVMAGRIFESLAANRIAKHGLTCHPFAGSEDQGVLLPAIPGGLTDCTIPCSSSSKIVPVSEKLTNDKTLYFFGKNMPGVDAYIPPNMYLQMTTTRSAKGSKTFRLSTLLEIAAKHAKDNDSPAHFVLAVPESELDKWSKLPSFDIDVKDEEMIKLIGAREKLGEVGKTMQREWRKLPEVVQAKLKPIRFSVGAVISRSFHSSAAARQLQPAALAGRPPILLPLRTAMRLLLRK